MALSPALRWEVLRALEAARERVAHGAPSLHAALYYLKLSQRGWAEVDRAVDEVRFDVPPEQLEAVALSQGGDNAEGLRLRDDLRAAASNAARPLHTWEDPGGLSRAQCVALLFIAREFLKRLPAVAAGPLLPHLPITRTEP